MWSGINFCPNEDKRYMIEINLRVSWPIIGGSRRELGIRSLCFSMPLLVWLSFAELRGE